MLTDRRYMTEILLLRRKTLTQTNKSFESVGVVSIRSLFTILEYRFALQQSGTTKKMCHLMFSEMGDKISKADNCKRFKKGSVKS